MTNVLPNVKRLLADRRVKDDLRQNGILRRFFLSGRMVVLLSDPMVEVKT
jgi:hypothetical protein